MIFLKRGTFGTATKMDWNEELVKDSYKISKLDLEKIHNVNNYNRTN